MSARPRGPRFGPALAGMALAAVLGACAGGSPAPGAPRPASANSNILRADEIAASGASNAYDAIMRLRPRFLMGRPSGGSGNEGVRIYVDGYFQRDPMELRSVVAQNIVYVRYLTAPEATTFWGTGFNVPVVYVLTRARAAP